MLTRIILAGNNREQLRLHCCQALCRVYMELRTWADESPRRLELAARQHLILYVQLSDLEEDGSPLWHVHPKHQACARVTS